MILARQDGSPGEMKPISLMRAATSRRREICGDGARSRATPKPLCSCQACTPTAKAWTGITPWRLIGALKRRKLVTPALRTPWVSITKGGAACRKTCLRRRAGTENRLSAATRKDNPISATCIAALQGQAAAQANLGAHLTTGDGGLADIAEGLRWTRLAAEQGDVTGSFNLGVAYIRGLGVLADRIQAHLWFSISLAQSTKRGDRSAARGDAGSVSETDKFDRLRAESALAKVRKEMSDAERAKADHLFGNWRPK